jgi:hypothetical protein
VVRSQSTVQGLLQGEIKKNTQYNAQVKTWDDARIGNIFSNARNGNARNGTNSVVLLFYTYFFCQVDNIYVDGTFQCCSIFFFNYVSTFNFFLSVDKQNYVINLNEWS